MGGERLEVASLSALPRLAAADEEVAAKWQGKGFRKPHVAIRCVKVHCIFIYGPLIPHHVYDILIRDGTLSRLSSRGSLYRVVHRISRNQFLSTIICVQF
ncbi:DEAD-box ATP-dependent RNA helicase 29 [Pyrus ussuriensis x Pyrus communis]|uniref:DEAD-box ATP-dependent RNA helicase 29 n=1 Tax=Pyrus ussuriensis x Pyrus communis TaxID=2448454 RepID=A0A5N5EXT5_9ROSA|nr:DEAD-box ATP-dependent RNA helicase 29 [Pyrus ussuriensis x Pyrus communis]